ncbi:hypothetical protein BDV97DRAFT_343790, partial [Delphinella strobiligena]
MPSGHATSCLYTIDIYVSRANVKAISTVYKRITILAIVLVAYITLYRISDVMRISILIGILLGSLILILLKVS